MVRTSRRAAVLSLAVLAGCASGSAPQTVLVWEKPGATREELAEARRACHEDIENPRAQRQRIEAELRGANFQKCMEERGWTWKTTQRRAD